MKRILFLVLLFTLSSSLVSAQKYGFINSEFILSKMPEYKEAKDRLDKMADRWTKEIEERYKVLNQKKEQFNKEEVLLPAEEKEKRSEELTKMENEVIELQKTRFGVSGEYFQKRQELIKPIQDKVYDAMQKVASKRSYTFIFDKANQSNLIYADKKFDLSDEVIKEMGLKP
jgi:outer membrane protein